MRSRRAIINFPYRALTFFSSRHGIDTGLSTIECGSKWMRHSTPVTRRIHSKACLERDRDRYKERIHKKGENWRLVTEDYMRRPESCKSFSFNKEFGEPLILSA